MMAALNAVLALIPRPLLLALLAGAMVFSGVQSVRLHDAVRDRQQAIADKDQADRLRTQAQGELDSFKAVQAQALADAQDKAKAKDEALQQVRKDAENAALDQQAKLAAAVARGADVDRRLRDFTSRLAAAGAGAGGGAGAQAAGSPQQCDDARAANRVLSDMLDRLVPASRNIAEFADRSAAAADACIAFYAQVKRRLDQGN